MAKRWLIDANKTAMENLWDACRVAAVTVLSRFKITHYKHEEFHDVLEELVLAGLEHFMRKRIQNHEYDRSHTFFENVYSSVWSNTNNVLRRHFKRLDRKISTFCIDTCFIGTELPLLDGLADLHGRPDEDLLMAEEEAKRKKEAKRIKAAKKAKVKMSYKERYHTDPEYRKKKIQRARAWHKAHPDYWREYAKRQKLKKQQEADFLVAINQT